MGISACRDGWKFRKVGTVDIRGVNSLSAKGFGCPWVDGDIRSPDSC